MQLNIWLAQTCKDDSVKGCCGSAYLSGFLCPRWYRYRPLRLACCPVGDWPVKLSLVGSMFQVQVSEPS